MTGRVLFVAAGADAGGPGALDGPFEVDVAQGAVDAMKRLRGGTASPDCVVVHAAVPDLPLEDFVPRVREATTGAAIVVVGELPATPGTAAALVDVDAYVPPGLEGSLIDRVQRVLAGRRIDRAVERHGRLAKAVGAVAAGVARSPDRDAVEAVTYDRLMAGDVYRQVWVGRVDEEGVVDVTVPVGGRLGEADLRELGGGADFVSDAVRRAEVVVAEGRAPTRGAAAAPLTDPVQDGGVNGGLESAVVPFVHRARVLGLGLVSTTATDAFDVAEQELLADLGAVVGHALASFESEAGGADGMDTLVHELRNPLSVAMSHLEIARESDDVGSLEQVDVALERVADTIDRVAAGVGSGASLDRTTVDLASIAEDAWAPRSTPSASLSVEDSATFPADRTMAVRLLANLFQNALDHAGESVAVRVGRLPDGFYVEDDGPGIPVEEREAVLERGYTTADDGLGLGLSIIQSVADAHGWTLTVGEAEDGGARFEITGISPAAEEGGEA